MKVALFGVMAGLISLGFQATGSYHPIWLVVITASVTLGNAILAVRLAR